MNKEIIEKLKKNERPYGLLSKEEQAFLEALDIKNVEYYAYDGTWGNFAYLIPGGVFRIKEDYKPEPEAKEDFSDADWEKNKMNKEIIEKLKGNETQQLCMLSDLGVVELEKARNKGFVQQLVVNGDYLSWNMLRKDSKMFGIGVYRISPEYQPEPEAPYFVEFDAVQEDNCLFFYAEVHLPCFVSSPGLIIEIEGSKYMFVGYKYDCSGKLYNYWLGYFQPMEDHVYPDTGCQYDIGEFEIVYADKVVYKLMGGE